MPVPDRRTANRYPHLREAIRAVTAAYAMRGGDGYKVLLCEPRDVELAFYPAPGRPEWRGNNGKICYFEQTATLAAEEISLIEGADPVIAYPCPRGGHWHHVDARRRARTIAACIDRIAAAAKRAAAR